MGKIKRVSLSDARPMYATPPAIAGTNVHPLHRSMTDSLTNFLSGMGTERDKLTGSQFAFNEMPRAQIEMAYRGDWVSRKVVDIPAYDMFREWRSWQADKDDITAVEELETSIGVQRKIMNGLIRGRLYGGAACILGVDQGNSQDPLDVESLGKDCLKFIHVVNRYELSSGPIDWDINSEYFGTPSYYERVTQTNGFLRFHPSRLVKFMGHELPDPSQAPQAWGDSVLQVCADAIMQMSTVSSAVAQLVQEAKLDIVKIPEMSERMADKDYEGRLRTRFALANTMKSIYSLLLVDKEEEWDRITQTFTGMPEVVQMYMLMASGSADIPATRFMAQAPAGMNATGDSDTRNYYDRLASERNMSVVPEMRRLDDILLISALGKKPDGVYYEWNPLWQMTETEKATVAKTKADTFKVDVDAGILNPEVLQRARENQLIEDGTYPGLEMIIEEYGDDIEDREDDNPVAANSNDPRLNPNDPAYDPVLAASQAAATSGAGAVPGAKAPPPPKNGPVPPPVKRTGTTDAAIDAMATRIRDAALDDASSPPRSLYMCRDVTNQKAIKAWYKKQGLATTLDDMHVTIIYSKEPVDWLKVGTGYPMSGDKDGNYTVKAGGPRVHQPFGKAFVLSFADSELAWRNRDARNQGATYDHDDYTPHVTLTWRVGTANLAKIKPYLGEIKLGPEIFEEIDSGFEAETDAKES